MQTKQQIVVTGGAGYVGSVLVPKLLDQGHSVKVLDLYMYGTEGLDPVKDHFADRLLLQFLRDGLAHLVSGILVSRTHLQRFLDLQGVRRHQGVPSLIVYC